MCRGNIVLGMAMAKLWLGNGMAMAWQWHDSGMAIAWQPTVHELEQPTLVFAIELTPYVPPCVPVRVVRAERGKGAVPRVPRNASHIC